MAALALLFALFCHQLPERSPQFAGVVIPLCSRCAGLYVGILASYLYVWVTGGRARRLPEVGVAIGATVLMVPFLVDGWGNTLHLWSSPDWLRALTGIGFGLVLPLVLVPLTGRPSAATASELPPTLARFSEVLVPASLGLVMVWLLLDPPSLFVFHALAFAAAGGLLMLLVDVWRAARPHAWRPTVGLATVPAPGTSARGSYG